MSNYDNEIDDVREWIQVQETKREILEKSLEESRKKFSTSESYLYNLKNARWVLSEVIRQTQLQFKGYVESLVTKCINTVFDRDFEFILEYEIKANKTYIKPMVREGDTEPQVPKEEMGVGILDLLSFALRVVLWSLERPRSRPVFVLDEPMRDLGKGKLLDRAGDVLKELSQRLKLQLILITHEPQLCRIADRVFEIEHNGKRSYLGSDPIKKEEYSKNFDKNGKKISKKRKRKKLK